MKSATCKVCGITFLAKAARFKLPTPPRFCSKPCFYKGRHNPGMTRYKHSEATIAAMRLRVPGIKGKHLSETAKAIIREKAIARHRAAGRTPWNKDKHRAAMRLVNRRRLLTPIGMLANRIGPLLRQHLRKKSGEGTPPRGTFRLLGYTPADLVKHITGCLEACGYACRMCGKSLREHYDVDHVVPLSTAKTIEGVIQLYALSNLDVLCAHCNRRVKRNRLAA